MFWLLRFRGERLGDTLALWINAVTWQLQKLLYKLTHAKSTKADFVSQILFSCPHRHWTRFPIEIDHYLYYDRKAQRWYDPTGIVWVYFEHYKEAPPLWFQGIKSGQIGLDVGAHRGFWSIFYGSRTLPAGLIFAWEPNPTNYQHLLRNIAKNRCTHIIPLRLAAWRENALLTLEYDETMPLHSFVSRVKESGQGDTIAVSIDALVEGLSLPRLDWIKMDIEGAEVEALQGARQTLRRYKPILWIEVHDTLDAVKSLLREADYEIKGENLIDSPVFQKAGYLWAEPRVAPA